MSELSDGDEQQNVVESVRSAKKLTKAEKRRQMEEEERETRRKEEERVRRGDNQHGADDWKDVSISLQQIEPVCLMENFVGYENFQRME